jgi:MFS family permease
MALPLIFYYVLEGSIVAFYTGFLYRIVKQSISSEESNTDVNLKIAYVFIVLGIFEFIGGILSGYLADKYNINPNN